MKMQFEENEMKDLRNHREDQEKDKSYGEYEEY